MAKTNALTLTRGNTLITNYTNQDNSTPPNAISLVGATVYFTVKPSPGYDSSTNDSTATWQVISTENTGNTCTFKSLPAQTWVAPATYKWDITIDYGSNNVVTAMSGTIAIVGTPTNSAS
jgi:hypothetical protein